MNEYLYSSLVKQGEYVAAEKLRKVKTVKVNTNKTLAYCPMRSNANCKACSIESCKYRLCPSD